jgi:hypothetical protein
MLDLLLIEVIAAASIRALGVGAKRQMSYE